MTAALAALGIACILYGMAIMAIGSGTWFFAVWYVIGAVLLASALAVHVGVWGRMPIVPKRAIEIVLGAAAIAFCVFAGMSFSGFSQKGEEGLDCIIVLGAQVRGDRPSSVLQKRLDTAADYLKRNPETRCIVSGGKGANEQYAEADVMGAYLEELGIDAARIVYERESRNTAENIENSMQLMNPKTDRVGIVTNNFHVFRGVGIARKKGIEHVCGIAAPTELWVIPNNVLRETFGIAKDLATGNL